MSRARHRLTTRQHFYQSRRKAEQVAGVFDAFIDADTYTWNVAGPINAGLGGEVGHTGGSSDAYIAAQFIQDQTTNGGIASSEFIEAGSNLVDWDVTYVDPDDIANWPFYFNYKDITDGGIDGWLASPTRRAYFYMDLSNKGPEDADGVVQPITSSDNVLSAYLNLSINSIVPHDWEDFSAPFELSRPRVYCVLKSLKQFSDSTMGDINWYGWTGGFGGGQTIDPTTDYWEEPGGSCYGVDITDLGISACDIAPDEYGFDDFDVIGPDAPDAQNVARYAGKGYRVGDLEVTTTIKSKSNPISASGFGDSLQFDITHLVQDAIDNENMKLRLCLIGYADISPGITSAPYGDIPPFYEYSLWKNTVRLYSSEYTGQEYLKPHVRIDFERG